MGFSGTKPHFSLDRGAALSTVDIRTYENTKYSKIFLLFT
jgi:hypothetical protein